MSAGLPALSGFTHFAQPLWLAAGLVAALLLPVLYHLHDRRQRRALASFALERGGNEWGVSVSRGLLWLRRACFIAAAVCGFVALAQPLGAMQMQATQNRGIDILFAIDTSRSMLAPDVRPNRLARAKLSVEDLLDQLGGDAVGLVAFAGEAFLQAPMTTDYDAFRETLQALDTQTVPLGGTDIAAAIRAGQEALVGRGDADPVLVLITDGEDLGGEALSAAKTAARAGMKIYTVGVGTAAGELIPLAGGGAGDDRFVRDGDGHFVKSRLDETTLRQVAEAAGGSYQPLGPQGQGVVDLYQHTLRGLARHAMAGRQVAVYAQLYQWPLGAALVLLVMEWLVRPVRQRRVVSPRLASALACLLLGALASRAHASQAEQQYGQGAQAYRSGHYGAAATAFRNALQTADVRLQQDAYYNLGNSLYRVGGAAAGADPQQAMQSWQQAIAAYDTALQLRPDDADAKFNRGVVQKKLDELQNQHNNQQKQNQQDNQQKQDSGANQQGQGGQQQPGKPQDPGQQGKPEQQNSPGQKPQQDSQAGQNPGQPQPGQNQDQNQNQNKDKGLDKGQQDQSDPRQAQAQQDPPVGQPPGGSGATGESRQPDQMTREEAERLLDSTRGQERRLAVGARNGKPDARPVLPVKDW